MVLGSIPNGAGTMVLLFLVHFLHDLSYNGILTCRPLFADLYHRTRRTQPQSSRLLAVGIKPEKLSRSRGVRDNAAPDLA